MIASKCVVLAIYFSTSLSQSDFNLSEEHVVKRSVGLSQIQDTTTLLDNLLAEYDSSLRPHYSLRQATVVGIDIHVRSMGPISEIDSSYSMDCYFRQTWMDPRLTFPHTNYTTLSLGMVMLDKIWKPDTYFWNGKRSYLHQLTTPNKLVRLQQDGTVLFSSRLTIKSKCDMDLHSFPMDRQKCQLVIGSFAYREEEMQYEWNGGGIYTDNIGLSQFSLVSTHKYNTTLSDRGGNYSAICAAFVLQRHGGYFVINFYVPATMIVLLSCVAFWINREATADRIGLGVTSILTMTFLALDARSDLPRVNYPTALDIYIIICFSFLFCCIIEFTVVHAYTKYRTGDPEMYSYEVHKIMNDETLMKHATRKCSNTLSILHNITPMLSGYMQYKNKTSPSSPPQNKSRISRRRGTENSLRRVPSVDFGNNSVSKIDRVARIIFPTTFCLVNIGYWKIYMQEALAASDIN